MSLFDEPEPGEVDLHRFDNAYSQIRTETLPPPAPGADIPDGMYDTRVEDARLGRARSSGNPMITFRLRIVAGEHQGRCLVKNSFITDKSLPVVKDELSRLNLNLDRFSDLPSRLAELADREVQVYKKTDGDWIRIYFCRTAVSARDGEGLRDDLPF